MFRTEKRVVLYIFGMAAILAAALALPGKTVVTKYLHDLLIFLDGAYRIEAGQVPNRDFHTALGPLTYLIPFAGRWLSGSYGAAMPAGIAAFVVLFAAPLAYVCASRLRAAVAVPYAAFLLLLIVVPIHLGDGINVLSFGMFYNRLGWAAVALLLTMFLQPRDGLRSTWADITSATFLTLLLIYLKASYGAVALGFLVFLLASPSRRGWASGALAAVALSVALIELLWGGTGTYLADLRQVSQVSGGIREGWQGLVRSVLRNLADYVLFFLVAALALWRTRSMYDLLFYGYCGASGLLLLSQNYQDWGIVTLAAGVVVAGETLTRHEVWGRVAARISAAGPVFPLFFVAPTIVHCLAALVLHLIVAVRSPEADPAGLPGLRNLVLADLWTGGDYQVGSRYLASLKAGADALRGSEGGERVLVLDFVSPFSVGLGLTPPAGDSTWHHWGRTLNEKTFPPAEQLFGGVDTVMAPKQPVEGWTSRGLQDLYADYIQQEFEVEEDSEYWTLHVRKPRP